MESPHYRLVTEIDERFTALQPEIQQSAYIAEIALRKMFRGLAAKNPGILTQEETESTYPAEMLVAMLPLFQETDKTLVKMRTVLAQLKEKGRR